MNYPLDTDLYCLTDSSHSLGRSTIDVVEKMISSGIKIIQYREKEKSMKEKYEECLKIREITKKANVRFIVNDHIDLALITDADGIHIGQDDLPVNEVRKILGKNKIIGLSTHSPAQAEEAVKLGVDYIGVGPIFKTYTKKDVCDPVGFEYLDFAAANIKIPFVAIGGIKEHNVSEVFSHGATCIAMVTEITGAEDIPEKISSIRNKLKS